MSCFHTWCGFEGRYCDDCAPPVGKPGNTAADWVNSIRGVRPTDQFIALDRRLFEDCVARAMAAATRAARQEQAA